MTKKNDLSEQGSSVCSYIYVFLNRDLKHSVQSYLGQSRRSKGQESEFFSKKCQSLG